MLFSPTHQAVFGDYASAATGQFAMLGAEQRGDNDTQIVRMIDGIEIAWEEQDTCDAARGCTFDVYHLRAGALRAGRGGCEDTEATAGQY